MKNTWLIKILCIVITIFVASCWTDKDVSIWEETEQIADSTITIEETQIRGGIPETANQWTTVTAESTIKFNY